MLERLGWDDHFAAEWSAAGEPRPVGRVRRLDRGFSTVDVDGPEMLRPRNFGIDVAVGDFVVVSPDGERITTVLARRSAFVRRASFEGARGEAHALAANLDYVFLVHALSHPPNQRRLERELVLAFDSGSVPIVILTKADLAVDEAAIDHAVRTVQAVAHGVAVHPIAARSGFGLDRLRSYAPVGQTVGLLGSSGTGKSTLVNALVGSEVQRTSEVREGDFRGRHTTVAAELVDLPGGGLLLDTPGLRAVSLWTAGEGLRRAFSDVTELAERCRFDDCSHRSEPDCAVHEAITAGVLSEQRLQSWLVLRDELDRLDTELVDVERSASRGRGRRARP